jgi:hypothetical protein
VFVTEAGTPVTTAWFLRMIQQTGRAAKFPFPVRPHMLRHSTGYKLANDGHDTRSLAHYLGHSAINGPLHSIGARSICEVLARLDEQHEHASRCGQRGYLGTVIQRRKPEIINLVLLAGTRPLPPMEQQHEHLREPGLAAQPVRARSFVMAQLDRSDNFVPMRCPGAGLFDLICCIAPRPLEFEIRALGTERVQCVQERTSIERMRRFAAIKQGWRIMPHKRADGSSSRTSGRKWRKKRSEIASA